MYTTNLDRRYDALKKVQEACAPPAEKNPGASQEDPLELENALLAFHEPMKADLTPRAFDALLANRQVVQLDKVAAEKDLHTKVQSVELSSLGPTGIIKEGESFDFAVKLQVLDKENKVLQELIQKGQLIMVKQEEKEWIASIYHQNLKELFMAFHDK